MTTAAAPDITLATSDPPPTETTAEMFVRLTDPLVVLGKRAQRKAAGDLAKLMGAPQKIYEALYAMPLVGVEANGDGE